MSTLADLYAAAPSARVLDTVEFDLNDQGVDTTMRFWVLGPDLPSFRNTVAGLPATTVVIGGASVSRLIPMKHPYEFNCYAYSLHLANAPDSVMGDDGGAGFSFADYFVDVKFRTPKFSYEGGSYPTVTRARQNGLEMVTRPGAAYAFPSDGARLKHDVGVPVLVVRYALTFHRLPSLNDDLFDSLAGCVNSVDFLGRPPGTVLYHGCSSTGELTLGGLPSYEATHEFEYRAIPHNQVMRDDGQGFEAPVQIADLAPSTPEDFLISSPRGLLPIADLTALYGS